jgi:O-antigen/teichoic acid export membrane protein
VRRLWRSPTIRSAAVYGAAGVGFAAANLILARVLPPAEYALVTLVVALVNVGYALSPAGIDGIVNRRDLEAGPRLLWRVLFATTAVGVVFAVIGALAYGISATFTAMIFASTAMGGVLMVAAAKFQSEQRFGLSLALFQSPNLVFLLAALVTVAAGVHEAWLALLIMTLGWFPLAIWGWTILLRERHAKPHRSAEFPWSEAFSFAGMQATGLLLIQLDRLVLPHVLPLRDLATYGVLAAIAGSLFRVLQMGVGYTLFPRLRAAADVRQRRRLVAKEARLVGAIVLVGSVAIWIVTPAIERWFLAGKYHLAGSLVLASVVSGIAKVFNAFTKSAASALATPRELSAVNAFGWASVAIGLVAATVGARWGLAGVIYGVAVGWMVRALSAFYFAARHLRLPVAEQAAEPATAP